VLGASIISEIVQILKLLTWNAPEITEEDQENVSKTAGVRVEI
jgi:hypothetical protein